MADEFPARVRALAGLSDDADAERLATGVLGALGDQLSGPVARRLAEGLPEPAALALRRAGEVAEPGGLDAFYAAVSERVGDGDPSAAVGSVLRALAETADPEAVRAAGEQLPDELGALLQTETSEAPTEQPMAGGPIEPDAPNVAGPDRPLG